MREIISVANTLCDRLQDWEDNGLSDKGVLSLYEDLVKIVDFMNFVIADRKLTVHFQKED